MIFCLLTGITYLIFRSSYVQTIITQNIVGRLSKKIDYPISIGGVDITYPEGVVLERVAIETPTNDSLIYIDNISISIDSLSLRGRAISFNTIKVSNIIAHIDSISPFIERVKEIDFGDNPWYLNLSNFILESGRVESSYIDLKDIETNIQLDLESKRFKVERLNLFDIKRGSPLYMQGEVMYGDSTIVVESLQTTGYGSSISIGKTKFLKSLLQEKSLFKEGAISPFSIEIESATLSPQLLALTKIDTTIVDNPIKLSGSIRGLADTVVCNNLQIEYGSYGYINGDVTINNIQDDKLRSVTADIAKSNISTTLLRELNKSGVVNIPLSIAPYQHVTYRGHIKVRKGVIFERGSLGGSFGHITSTLTIKRDRKGAPIIDGRVTTKEFQIGKLIDKPYIGGVNSEITVTGVYQNSVDYILNIRGAISKIAYRDRVVTGISIDGEKRDNAFDGIISIDDPNLSLYLSGEIRQIEENQKLKLFATVNKLNPDLIVKNKLDIDNISGSIIADIDFSDIENFYADIAIEDISITNRAKNTTLNDLRIRSSSKDDSKEININSDFIDINTQGDFYFRSIAKNIKQYISQFVSGSTSNIEESLSPVRLDFTINIKEEAHILDMLYPKYALKEGTFIEGWFDSNKRQHQIRSNIPLIKVGNSILEGIVFNSTSIDNKIQNRITMKRVDVSNKISMKNIIANNSLCQNALSLDIAWSNNDTISNSGTVKTRSVIVLNDSSRVESLRTTILPTDIWLEDSLWHISESEIFYNRDTLTIDGLNITNNIRSCSIDGIYSNNASDQLSIAMKNIDIAMLEPLSAKEKEFILGGVVNGEVSLAKIDSSNIAIIDLEIARFSVKDSSMGDIKIKSRWNQIDRQLDTYLLLHNKEIKHLEATGFIDPIEGTISLKSQATQLPFSTLSSVLSGFAYNLGGKITGYLNIDGKISKPTWDGELFLDKGKIGIKTTGVTYEVTDTVRFVDDKIAFNSIYLFDSKGDSGTLDGYISHTMFQDMHYKLDILTRGTTVLNIEEQPDKMFYGFVNATGSLQLRGTTQNLIINIDGKTDLGSDLTIPLSSPASASNNNFISFIDYKAPKIKDDYRKERAPIKSSESSYTMNLNITATPQATVKIIFDQVTGDMLTASGLGDLNIVYSPNRLFTMNGEYKISKGEYVFNLKNYILSKRFKLSEGGSIVWTGDPYEGTILANAVYSTRSSLYNLLQESAYIDYSKRIKIDCIINLSEMLSNPKVSFDIGLPTADERTKSEVSQYLTTDDDITTQILSLLITGQFTTPAYLASSSSGSMMSSNLVGSTASEMLSSQLSNILTNLTGDVDLGFNYRPGDDVTNRQVEVAMSTQLLNNRLTISSNIGQNSGVNSNASNGDFIGELEMFFKVNKSGKLQLKAYNRSNDDLVYTTALYTQGVGLTYGEDFNNFADLTAIYNERKRNKREERRKRRENRQKRKEARLKRKESL